MKRLIIACMLVLAMTSGAFAQANFPAMDVVDTVGPAVVSIDVNRVVYGATTMSLVGDLASYTRLATNYLTGFIYTENGYIVTDAANITEATILTVWLDDGTELDAELIGIDEEYGIGVIKIESEKPLTPVKMVDARYDPINEVYPYAQGDPVVAIGYSGGLGGTVTSGIISAIRNLRNRNYILIPSVIQSDAAINTGNEGCPLFNERGEVIGIHDQRSGGMQNTTFFMPVWLVKRVADEIIASYEESGDSDDPDVWHPWLGIKPFAGSVSPLTGQLRTVGDDLKMYLDIPDQYWDVGILIDEVWLESPAREFGILPHDMVVDLVVFDEDDNVKVPYRLIKTVEELELLVTTADRGDKFIFGVIRNFKYLTLEVEIGNHPGSFTFLAYTNFELERSEDYF